METTDREIQTIIDQILTLAPEPPDTLTEAEQRRLDGMLAFELTEFDQNQHILQHILDQIRERIEAGETISHIEAHNALELALEQLEGADIVRKMYSLELNRLDAENRRLRQLQQPVIVPFDVVGNA